MTSGRDDQRPGAGDALLLAAGELGWAGGSSRSPQADGVDDRVEPGLVGLAAGDRQRQQDVLLGGQRRQQVELLEDEADLVAAQLGQAGVAQAGDLGVADVDLAAGDRVEAGQAVHQRRLAGAGRAHDRGEPAPLELDADPAQRDDLRLAAAVDLPHVRPPGRGHLGARRS